MSVFLIDTPVKDQADENEKGFLSKHRHRGEKSIQCRVADALQQLQKFHMSLRFSYSYRKYTIFLGRLQALLSCHTQPVFRIQCP